jgi:glycosyltransferase involved in cell wall biosynthesis
VLHFVVPEGIDDASCPSGGNRYDRQLCEQLLAAGFPVREYRVAGRVGAVLAPLPDEAVVLVDGLIASGTPEVLVPAARRLRLAVLLHMLTGDARERAVLSAATSVITTSHWGRDHVIARHRLPPGGVHVAVPGADRAPIAPGTPDGSTLLCVAAVALHKGQHDLLRALASLADRPWQLTCAGSLDRDPGFVIRLRRQADADGIAERVTFTGPLAGNALDRAYATADVLVHPSHGEMYGLVINEALARGLPVIASDVGGVPEALGSAGAGLLVPPNDPAALAAALRVWLSSRERRTYMRVAALERRASLPAWATTARAVAAALGL